MQIKKRQVYDKLMYKEVVKKFTFLSRYIRRAINIIVFTTFAKACKQKYKRKQHN